MKAFDAVQTMRRIRDRISEEIADLDHDQLVRGLRSEPYEDPFLQRLSEQAALRRPAADTPKAGALYEQPRDVLEALEVREEPTPYGGDSEEE